MKFAKIAMMRAVSLTLPGAFALAMSSAVLGASVAGAQGSAGGSGASADFILGMGWQFDGQGQQTGLYTGAEIGWAGGTSNAGAIRLITEVGEYPYVDAYRADTITGADRRQTELFWPRFSAELYQQLDQLTLAVGTQLDSRGHSQQALGNDESNFTIDFAGASTLWIGGGSVLYAQGSLSQERDTLRLLTLIPDPGAVETPLSPVETLIGGETREGKWLNYGSTGFELGMQSIGFVDSAFSCGNLAFVENTTLDALGRMIANCQGRVANGSDRGLLGQNSAIGTAEYSYSVSATWLDMSAVGEPVDLEIYMGAGFAYELDTSPITRLDIEAHGGVLVGDTTYNDFEVSFGAELDLARSWTADGLARAYTEQNDVDTGFDGAYGLGITHEVENWFSHRLGFEWQYSEVLAADFAALIDVQPGMSTLVTRYDFEPNMDQVRSFTGADEAEIGFYVQASTQMDAGTLFSALVYEAGGEVRIEF